MVEKEQIDLVDADGIPLLKKQISLFAENNPVQKNAQGDTGAADEEEGSPVNIRVDSPDASKLAKAELQVQEKRYSELQSKVVDFVRRNSLLKEAKALKIE